MLFIQIQSLVHVKPVGEVFLHPVDRLLQDPVQAGEPSCPTGLASLQCNPVGYLDCVDTTLYLADLVQGKPYLGTEVFELQIL